jgi:hypothetical protein
MSIRKVKKLCSSNKKFEHIEDSFSRFSFTSQNIKLVLEAPADFPFKPPKFVSIEGDDVDPLMAKFGFHIHSHIWKPSADENFFENYITAVKGLKRPETKEPLIYPGQVINSFVFDLGGDALKCCSECGHNMSKVVLIN